jgi:oligopeptide transport system permease protein
MNGVLPFVVRRLLAAIPVLVAVTAITFFLGRFAPGDPITIRTGGRASPEAIANIKHQLHLDQNPVVQYVAYMGNLLQGDFGVSYKHPGVDVKQLIMPRIKVTAEENIYPTILVFLLGIPLGIYLAQKQGTWQDPSITTSLLLIYAVPEVILIPLLQYVFAIKLGLVPASGWKGIFSSTVVLPTIALTLPGVAGIARLMRISLLQVIDEEYVRTARAKGLAERVVVYRHMLRNAILPIITTVIVSIFFLFSGSFFVETFLGIPGIGAEAINSVLELDYDVFMAIVVLSAIAFILANIVVDIAYSIIDPRIRLNDAA